MDYKRGEFISIRHSKVRDLYGSLLSEVCKDLCTEPILQPSSGETYQHRSTNIDKKARLDAKARHFLMFVLPMSVPPHLEASQPSRFCKIGTRQNKKMQ